MNDYPILKVTLLYAFLGSAIGASLVAIFFISMPGFAFLLLLFGIMVGFIPALFTGLVISFLGLTKNNPKHYLIMAMIGGLNSALFSLITTKELLTLFVIIGTISSAITGAMVLPTSQYKEISDE